MDVTTLGPAEFCQSLRDNTDARLRFCIILARGHEDANPTHSLCLLRKRRKWQAVAEPAIALMKSRRRIAFPKGIPH